MELGSSMIIVVIIINHLKLMENCKFHLLIKISIHTNLKMHIKLNIFFKYNNDVIKNYNPKVDIKVHIYN